MNSTRIAVVIPHYQKQAGLLPKALASVFAQTIADDIHVFVIDDESPVSAEEEIAAHPEFPREQLTIHRQANGGAGSARNRGLDLVVPGTPFVAFLDSDDEWRPAHLANAMQVLAAGPDAYFSDWSSFNLPHATNFQQHGKLAPSQLTQISSKPDGYELGVSPIEHITCDGGGVIQTSTVVYHFSKYPQLRFREEFFNGQDFFFWMDLGELGARFAFSTEVDCHNGEGINIYQSAGWGTERSLHRLRNELFVWTSVRRIYKLTHSQRANNLKTIRNLEAGVVRDVLHRLRRRKPIMFRLLIDIVGFDPFFPFIAATLPLRLLCR
jgi:succinoglycan biosynthesis protein ExoW